MLFSGKLPLIEVKMRLFGLEISTSRVDSGRRSNSGVFNEGYWTTIEEYRSESKMRSSAVYSCVRLIAETIGSLPLVLYEELPKGGQIRAKSHPLFWTLNQSPNRRTTRMEFIETMCWHLLLRGNAYARIVFGRGGKIELEMLHPDKMKVEVTDKGTLAYTHTDGGKVTKYTQYDIVHVRGHSQDGILGVSPIQANKMGVIDRAETMEDFHTNTYKNGVKLSGILQSPVGSEVDEMEADRLTKSFQKAYGGPANPSKVVLLPSGVTFETVSMTMEDAQFIDGRKLTRSEIAGIFGVPPHMIGDLDKSSFSNIENMSLNYLIYTIRCWLVRIEQAFSKGLFSTEDQQKYNIEFLADDLLRGDTLSRATAQKMRVESGSKTPNEVRAQEKENPLDWGDYTVVPANFRTITSKEDLKNPAPAVPTTKTNTKDEAGGETP